MKYILMIIISLVPLFFSCKVDKTPLAAETNNYSSHEYEWQIDTLKAPDALQILMRGIWGKDENNVWAVGHSDDARYKLWHWDGSIWENIRLLFSGHPNSYSAIYGFSENDIWAVGTDFQNYPNTEFRSFIIHFDGSEWKLIDEINAPWCFSVWGTSSSNLFVGSDSGLILHYDGNTWVKQSTNTRSQILSIWGFSESEVYAAGLHYGNVQPIDSTFYYIYRYYGQNWEILHSALDYPFAPPLPFGSELWVDGNNTLYSVGGDGLYKSENETWLRLRNETLYAIHGNRWNNIFAAGPWNNILHFNGDAWRRYDFFNDYSFDAGFAFWCNDNYVFMTAELGYRSFVIRGNLKERR